MVKTNKALFYCPYGWCCGIIYSCDAAKVIGKSKPRCPRSAAPIPMQLSEADWKEFKNPLVLLNSQDLWTSSRKLKLAREACGYLRGLQRHLFDLTTFLQTLKDAFGYSQGLQRRPSFEAFEAAEGDVAKCDLLRDIIGNPFCAVALDPAWLTHDVTALAQAIYDERRFDHMPILGDALEEAGCMDEEILGHCHNGKEHARGCWLVDLLLGDGVILFSEGETTSCR